MSTFRHAAVIAAIVFVIAGCEQKAPDTAAEAAAIKSHSLAWFEHYNAGDADGVADLYAEDAVVMAPSMQKLVGRAAIRDYIAGDIAASKSAGISMQGDAVADGAVDGNTAWISGSFAVKDAAGITIDTGKYLTVYRRTDGQWPIVRDIWNLDSAAAPTRTVIITAKVQDAARWEAGFRTHADLFKSQTVHSPIRYATTDKNDVTIQMVVDDLDKYMSIIDSPATAEAMAYDGVKRETVKFSVLDKQFDLD